MLMLLGLVALNFVISIFNAWSVGRSWAETKAVGGVARFMAWCGAIMSACGFTYCYAAVGGMVAQRAGYLTPEQTEVMFSAVYLAVIFPILGSGLAITVQSWAYAWRERNLLSGAGAAWNTFAQVYNTVQAFRGVPEAFGKVFDAVTDSESDTSAKVLPLLFAVAMLLAGVLTTTAIIQVTARRAAERTRETVFRRRAAAGAQTFASHSDPDRLLIRPSKPGW